MKKLVSLAVAWIVFCSALILPVSAEEKTSITLVPSSKTIRIGDTVTITGNFKGTMVGAFDIHVKYNADQLTYVSAEEIAPVINAGELEVNPSSGRIQLVYLDADGGNSGITTGEAFKIEFKVSGGNVGKTIILSTGVTAMGDPNIIAIEVGTYHASMTIAAPLSGNTSSASVSSSPSASVSSSPSPSASASSSPSASASFSSSGSEEYPITISGILTDEQGNPLSGKTVELHSTPQITTTDKKGFYEFKNVLEGAHTLFVKEADGAEIGQLPIVITISDKASVQGSAITVKGDTTIDLLLKADGLALKNVLETKAVIPVASAGVPLYGVILLIMFVLALVGAIIYFIVARRNKSRV